MTDSSTDTLAKVIGGGSIAFGVLATVSPRALRKAYGTSAQSPELDYFGRMWGTRTTVLGALTLASSGAERQRLAGMAAAMNAVDSLAAFTSSGTPARTRVMAGLTSAAFGAAAGYVAANG
jgi:hypothetical protein